MDVIESQRAARALSSPQSNLVDAVAQHREAGSLRNVQPYNSLPSFGLSPEPTDSPLRDTLKRQEVEPGTSDDVSRLRADGDANSAQRGQPGGLAEDESYDDGLTFVQHMIAGSIAGMTEHMAMFPVDTVKTRMQALREATTAPSLHPSSFPLQPPPSIKPLPQSLSSAAVGLSPSSAPHSPLRAFLHALRYQGSAANTPSVYRVVSEILKKEGPAGLYRGIGAMGLGAGPAHAVYFAVYELAKESFGGNEKGHRPLAHAGAGAVATVASDAVLTPMDVVKQRLQLGRSPYNGVVDCCQKLMKQEGIRAFYTSYRTTLVMNVPFTAVHFATYEAAKRVLGGGNEADEDRLSTHLIAGGAAGALASAVTNPLDVVKTRLQCQGVCGFRRFKSGSVLGAMRSLVAEEGPGVLLKGMRARVMFHTPAAAICWSTYEACKDILKGYPHQ